MACAAVITGSNWPSPTKRMFTLDNAAHSVAFEQFEAFDTIMRETVLPETYPER